MLKKLADIEKIDRDWLTPAQIAPILGTNGNMIRWQAHNEPEKLGFNVIVLGTRVKIPRLAFIRFMRGENIEVPQSIEQQQGADT